jgi:hypothetical protein
MLDLVMICPTKGRPAAVARLAEQFMETRRAASMLVFVVDEDDPQLPGYQAARDEFWSSALEMLSLPSAGRTGCVTPLNAAWRELAVDGADAFAYGFLGDDHWPVTDGWDVSLVEALRGLGTGLAYGDDLHHGERLPTAVAMTADIPRALGYLAPPAFRHLYVDNYWLRLGREADAIRYLSDVVIEHRHPIAGKAPMDHRYEVVNAPLMQALDKGALWGHLKTGGMARDVELVRGLRRATAAGEAPCSTRR